MDSRARGNDECEGIPTDAGMTRPTVVTASIHPGSESGTCFHSNRSCLLAPAHEGMKIGCIGWWESSSVIATTRTSPLDSRLRGNDELGGRNDEIAEWWGSTARSKAA